MLTSTLVLIGATDTRHVDVIEEFPFFGPRGSRFLSFWKQFCENLLTLVQTTRVYRLHSTWQPRKEAILAVLDPTLSQ